MSPYSNLEHVTTSWNIVVRCCNKPKDQMPTKSKLLPCEDLNSLYSGEATDEKEQIFSTACKF